jgi:uncharacterized RDD family membrane protein YckC
MNYFNYFTDIETRFQQRRGSLLMLSTLDWALIETWREAGIPLEAVLRGIDAAFDKHAAQALRSTRRQRKINGLAWCAQAVLEAVEQSKEAAIGTAQPSATEPRESGFEAARIAHYLERNAALLTAAAPNLPSPANATAAEAAARLRELTTAPPLLSSRTLSEVEGEGSAFSARPAPLPHIASIPRRLMAAAIDTSVLFAGFLAFAAAFLFSAGRSNLWQPAAAISDASFPLDRHPALARLAVQFTAHTGLQPGLALASSLLVLALLYLLYQALFFSFSESTPGMRCARIALCTFDDENPTRGAMRRRNLAVLLSACPLGLGLLWAAFDEDRLTWHDRLTRTYQRIY